MAVEANRNTLPGVTAAADLTAGQHRLVKVTGDFEVDLAGDGEQVDGVLGNCPDTGEEALVMRGPLVKIEAGAAVTAGTPLASDATGRAVTATSGEYIVGRALQDASGAGEIISVSLSPSGRLA